MKKQFAVIGLGKFGMSIARTLSELDTEVLVIDHNVDRINEAAAFSTCRADDVRESSLQSLGIGIFDVVCVCIGRCCPLMITCSARIRVANDIAKSGSELHAKVLGKVGADQVVFPENDTGISMAHKLVSSNILDFIELSPDYGIAEFGVYEKWEEKSLIELDFRKKYGLNVIAIRHGGEINVSPLPVDVLHKDDVIVVIGAEDQIGKLEELADKR
jgi:trk system potassium uptake protein TrkA